MLGDVAGLTVLDLFAGSGALGIEALSRGAATAVFVDRDAAAVACIRRNLASLELTADVHRRDALSFLDAERRKTFSVVFVDPPYSSAGELGRRLSQRLPPVVPDEGLIVSESDRRQPLDLDLPLIRERIYGDTRIAFHRVR